ncbi:hypothetical protein C8R31_103410 [Nitrosospira sp. Nsp2]|nr:hypothetical protein C8R31_103410 [Nitrosospira sp. Nsp2]
MKENLFPPNTLKIYFRHSTERLLQKKGDKYGWGIGLPYVRSVAESHGGSIAVDSAVGQGKSLQ